MAELRLNGEWDDLERAFNSLTAEIESTVRGITVEVWDTILRRTPQYYGRMVVSYTYSIGRPIAVDRSYLVEPSTERQIEETPIKSKGRIEAIQLANFYNADRDMPFRLGDTVYITNGVDHGEGHYGLGVEEGSIRLRAVNLPGQPVKRTLDSITARYAKNISPNRANWLRQQGILG